MSSNHHHWSGGTGEQYFHIIHKMPCRPYSNNEGNYVFAKLVDDNWQAVYIGEGKLRDRYDEAMNKECVTDKDATHYHWHLNADADERFYEEADMIDGNDECMEPTGCNRQRPKLER